MPQVTVEVGFDTTLDEFIAYGLEEATIQYVSGLYGVQREMVVSTVTSGSVVLKLDFYVDRVLDVSSISIRVSDIQEAVPGSRVQFVRTDTTFVQRPAVTSSYPLTQVLVISCVVGLSSLLICLSCVYMCRR